MNKLKQRAIALLLAFALVFSNVGSVAGQIGMQVFAAEELTSATPDPSIAWNSDKSVLEIYSSSGSSATVDFSTLSSIMAELNESSAHYIMEASPSNELWSDISVLSKPSMTFENGTIYTWCARTQSGAFWNPTYSYASQHSFTVKVYHVLTEEITGYNAGIKYYKVFHNEAFAQEGLETPEDYSISVQNATLNDAGDGYTTSAVTANVTVTVTYTAETDASVTLSSAGESSVAIVANGTTSALSQGVSFPVPENQKFSISATPKTNYYIKSVTVDDEDITAGGTFVNGVFTSAELTAEANAAYTVVVETAPILVLNSGELNLPYRTDLTVDELKQNILLTMIDVDASAPDLITGTVDGVPQFDLSKFALEYQNISVNVPWTTVGTGYASSFAKESLLGAEIEADTEKIIITYAGNDKYPSVTTYPDKDWVNDGTEVNVVRYYNVSEVVTPAGSTTAKAAVVVSKAPVYDADDNCFDFSASIESGDPFEDGTYTVETDYTETVSVTAGSAGEVSYAGGEYTVSNITSDIAVSITYTGKDANVTVGENGLDGASVTLNGNAFTGSASVAAGETVTLVVTPEEGTYVSEVTVNGNALEGAYAAGGVFTAETFTAAPNQGYVVEVTTTSILSKTDADDAINFLYGLPEGTLDAADGDTVLQDTTLDALKAQLETLFAVDGSAAENGSVSIWFTDSTGNEVELTDANLAAFAAAKPAEVTVKYTPAAAKYTQASLTLSIDLQEYYILTERVTLPVAEGSTEESEHVSNWLFYKGKTYRFNRDSEDAPAYHDYYASMTDTTDAIQFTFDVTGAGKNDVTVGTDGSYSVQTLTGSVTVAAHATYETLSSVAVGKSNATVTFTGADDVTKIEPGTTVTVKIVPQAGQYISAVTLNANGVATENVLSSIAYANGVGTATFTTATLKTAYTVDVAAADILTVNTADLVVNYLPGDAVSDVLEQLLARVTAADDISKDDLSVEFGSGDNWTKLDAESLEAFVATAGTSVRFSYDGNGAKYQSAQAAGFAVTFAEYYTVTEKIVLDGTTVSEQAYHAYPGGDITSDEAAYYVTDGAYQVTVADKDKSDNVSYDADTGSWSVTGIGADGSITVTVKSLCTVKLTGGNVTATVDGAELNATGTAVVQKAVHNVVITPDANRYITGIKVNGTALTLNDASFNSGVYSFTYNTANGTEHSIEVTTEQVVVLTADRVIEFLRGLEDGAYANAHNTTLAELQAELFEVLVDTEASAAGVSAENVTFQYLQNKPDIEIIGSKDTYVELDAEALTGSGYGFAKDAWLQYTNSEEIKVMYAGGGRYPAVTMDEVTVTFKDWYTLTENLTLPGEESATVTKYLLFKGDSFERTPKQMGYDVYLTDTETYALDTLEVSGTGIEVTADKGYRVTDASADVSATIVVIKKTDSVITVVENKGNATVTFEGQVEGGTPVTGTTQPAGAMVTVSVVPAENMYIQQVVVYEADDSAKDNKLFAEKWSDGTYTATFTTAEDATKYEVVVTSAPILVLNQNVDLWYNKANVATEAAAKSLKQQILDAMVNTDESAPIGLKPEDYVITFKDVPDDVIERLSSLSLSNITSMVGDLQTLSAGGKQTEADLSKDNMDAFAYENYGESITTISDALAKLNLTAELVNGNQLSEYIQIKYLGDKGQYQSATVADEVTTHRYYDLTVNVTPLNATEATTTTARVEAGQAYDWAAANGSLEVANQNIVPTVTPENAVTWTAGSFSIAAMSDDVTVDIHYVEKAQDIKTGEMNGASAALRGGATLSNSATPLTEGTHYVVDITPAAGTYVTKAVLHLNSDTVNKTAEPPLTYQNGVASFEFNAMEHVSYTLDVEVAPILVLQDGVETATTTVTYYDGISLNDMKANLFAALVKTGADGSVAAIDGAEDVVFWYKLRSGLTESWIKLDSNFAGFKSEHSGTFKWSDENIIVEYNGNGAMYGYAATGDVKNNDDAGLKIDLQDNRTPTQVNLKSTETRTEGYAGEPFTKAMLLEWFFGSVQETKGNTTILDKATASELTVTIQKDGTTLSGEQIGAADAAITEVKGTYTITITYKGNNQYAPSTSASVSLVVTDARADTTTALKSDQSIGYAGIAIPVDTVAELVFESVKVAADGQMLVGAYDPDQLSASITATVTILGVEREVVISEISQEAILAALKDELGISSDRLYNLIGSLTNLVTDSSYQITVKYLGSTTHRESEQTVAFTVYDDRADTEVSLTEGTLSMPTLDTPFDDAQVLGAMDFELTSDGASVSYGADDITVKIYGSLIDAYADSNAKTAADITAAGEYYVVVDYAGDQLHAAANNRPKKLTVTDDRIVTTVSAQNGTLTMYTVPGDTFDAAAVLAALQADVDVTDGEVTITKITNTTTNATTSLPVKELGSYTVELAYAGSNTHKPDALDAPVTLQVLDGRATPVVNLQNNVRFEYTKGDPLSAEEIFDAVFQSVTVNGETVEYEYSDLTVTLYKNGSVVRADEIVLDDSSSYAIEVTVPETTVTKEATARAAFGVDDGRLMVDATYTDGAQVGCSFVMNEETGEPEPVITDAAIRQALAITVFDEEGTEIPYSTTSGYVVAYDKLLSQMQLGETYHAYIHFGGNDLQAGYDSLPITFTLVDGRTPTEILVTNAAVSVPYNTITTKAQLIETVGASVQARTRAGLTDAMQTYLDGTLVTDETDLVSLMPVGEYTVTFKFAGDVYHKPAADATATVTVVKADTEVIVESGTVKYEDIKGTGVNVSDRITTAADTDKYVLDMVQFSIGLSLGEDAAEDGAIVARIRIPQIIDLEAIKAQLYGYLDSLDAQVPGSSAVAKPIVDQLIGYIEDLLDSLANDGQALSLDELNELLQNLLKGMQDAEGSLGDLGIDMGLDTSGIATLLSILEQLEALEGFDNLVFYLVMGDDIIETESGLYLIGGVTTDSNYNTASNIGYLFIQPDGQKAELAFNMAIENGFVTRSSLLDGSFDMGTHVEKVYEGTVEEAQQYVSNLYIGVDINGEVYIKNQPGAEVGAYTQIGYILDVGNEMYYAVPVFRAYLVLADLARVDFIDAAGEVNNNQSFVFDGEPQPMTAKVFDRETGEELPAAEQAKLTYRYVGLEGDVEGYYSTTAPTHVGVYAVLATYMNDDHSVVGMGIGTLTITPADATVTVEDATHFYDGKPYDVTQMITVEDAVANDDPKVTIITGGVSVGHDLATEGFAALDGHANVDFPARIDNLFEQVLPEAYANGVSAGTLSAELARVQTKLVEAGIELELLDSIQSLLAELPQNTILTFDEQSEVNPTDDGLYLVAAVVTDYDYKPAMDIGLLVITHQIAEIVFVDETGAENNDRVFTFDGTPKEMPVKVTITGPNGSEVITPADERWANLTVTYVGIEGDADGYNSTTPPTHVGAYTVLATYLDEENHVVGAATGAMVIKPAQATIQVNDLTHIYDGNTVDIVAEMIEKTPDDAKMAVVTGALNTNADILTEGFGALDGWVNIDFPARIDTVMRSNDTLRSYYENGISVGTFSAKLTELQETLVAAGVEADAIAAIQELLAQMPQDAFLTFKEQSEVNPSAVGIYGVAAVILDYDYEPVADYGLLIIAMKDANVIFVDESGAENNDRRFEYDGTPKAMPTAVYINGQLIPTDQLQGELTVYYVGVGIENGGYASATPPTEIGAYEVTAIYIEHDADGQLVAADIALGVMTIEPATPEFEIADYTEVPFDWSVQFDPALDESVNDQPGQDDPNNIIVKLESGLNALYVIVEHTDDTSAVNVRVLLPRGTEVEDTTIPVGELVTMATSLVDMLPEEYRTNELVLAVVGILEKITATINEVSVGTIDSNGLKPVQVGTYDIYGLAYAKNYYPAVESGVLVITEPEATPTPTIPDVPNPPVIPTPPVRPTPSGTPEATTTPEPTATADPTATPTVEPSATPTAEPSATPTVEPSATPTVEPSATPTVEPSATPTVEPSATPTAEPTATPTAEPSATPTVEPSATPTAEPSATPTVEPSATPTAEPTATPTAEPTATPTAEPTATPTAEPTATPTAEPSATPTAEPTATPTAEPSATPTAPPTAEPTPTVKPTAEPVPTPAPTAAPAPSASPKTADEFALALYSAMATLSAAAFLLLIAKKRKESEE